MGPPFFLGAGLSPGPSIEGLKEYFALFAVLRIYCSVAQHVNVISPALNQMCFSDDHTLPVMCYNSDMGDKWPKIIRDPVHNIIVFKETPLDKLLIELINSREFQRLRRIRQLGFSSLIFPGACHDRFSHSIGVLHITKRILDRLGEINVQIDEETFSIIQIAALLHDIGHGPFSHAFERVTNINHERWTSEIIKSDQTEVGQILAGNESIPDLPNKLISFFIKDPSETGDANGTPAYQKQIVSSQLDADRFDYLLRDAHYTGASYGIFDLEWLIQTLHVEGEEQFLTVGYKGINATHEYILARYHMYKSVYYHKAVRSAEVMLSLIFEYLSKEIQKGQTLQNLVGSTSEALNVTFSRSKDLHHYLNLDDYSIWELVRSCCQSKFPVLSYAANGLFNRHLMKCIEVDVESNIDFDKRLEFYNEAKRILGNSGFDPDFYLRLDTPSDTPYKPFDIKAARNPEGFTEQLKNQLFVLTLLGDQVSILDACPPVQALEKYKLERWYFPEAIKSEMTKHRGLLQPGTN